ncbi:MAG: UbiA family prenyltransferase [Planctomycetota bacterium]
MQRLARRFIAAIELSRLPVAFGSVANVWLMVLLARADEKASFGAPVQTMPLWQALAAGALVALGFLVFGAALNDFLDAKHDRAFAPGRPLPSGGLSPRRAMQIAMLALLSALLGSLAFGTGAGAAAIALAALVFVYDAFAKHVPALGIVLAGLATAMSMAIPFLHTADALPVWLAMSQTMGVGLLAYVLGEKRPRLTRRAVVAGVCGWLFWSAAILAIGARRAMGDGVAPAEDWLSAVLGPWSDLPRLALPAAATVGCAVFALWKVRGARGARATDKLLRYGSLWKGVVAAAWLASLGMHAYAAWIAGISIGLFMLLALLRETGPQLADPAGWRS